MSVMNDDSRARVTEYLHAVSGPPVSRGSSWQPTVAFNLGSPVELRRLVILQDSEARELMSRGLLAKSFAPKVGTTGPRTSPALPLPSTPANVPTGLGFGIGVGIGESVAGMVIEAERIKQTVLEQGFAQTKAEEDAQFFASICGALQLAMASVPTRVENRTMRRKKKFAEDRVRIHGWSRRSSS